MQPSIIFLFVSAVLTPSALGMPAVSRAVTAVSTEHMNAKRDVSAAQSVSDLAKRSESVHAAVALVRREANPKGKGGGKKRKSMMRKFRKWLKKMRNKKKKQQGPQDGQEQPAQGQEQQPQAQEQQPQQG